MKLKSDFSCALMLWSIVVLGLGLRLYHLDFFPLWLDETFTRFYSESSLSYLWTTGLQRETDPPGYYTIMHFWMPIFGTSESALRFPSVLASTLAILAVYQLGKKLEGRGVGLIGALCMALAPIEIWYGQEARTYALLQLGIAVWLISLAGFLFRPASLLSLAGYILSATFAIYLHVTSVLLVLACNLVVVGATLGKSPLLGVRELARWVMANVILAVLVLPQMVAIWKQLGSPNIQWMPPLTFAHFFNVLSELVGGTAARYEMHDVHGALLLLLLAVTLRPLRPLNRLTVILLIQLPCLYLGLLVLVSLKQPILLPRTIVWEWLPLSLLLGMVLLRSRVRWALLMTVAVIFLVGLSAQIFPAHALKGNGRKDFMGNRKLFAQSGVVAFNSVWFIGPMAYYLPEDVSRMKFWPGDAPPSNDFLTTFFFERFKIPRVDAKDLLHDVASGKGVSLVFLAKKRPPADASLSNFPQPDLFIDDEVDRLYWLQIFVWNSKF